MAEHTRTRKHTTGHVTRISKGGFKGLLGLSMAAKGGATLCLDLKTARALFVLRKIDETQRGIRLSGAQECRGVDVSRIMVRAIEVKVSFRVKDGRLCEI